MMHPVHWTLQRNYFLHFLFMLSQSDWSCWTGTAKLSINDEEIIVAAIPYLRDQDIRRAIATESFEEINNRYKTALINHYTEAASGCLTMNIRNSCYCHGHLFALEVKHPKANNNLCSNLGDIGAADSLKYLIMLPLDIYIEHKGWRIRTYRYSGSPYIEF